MSWNTREFTVGKSAEQKLKINLNFRCDLKFLVLQLHCTTEILLNAFTTCVCKNYPFEKVDFLLPISPCANNKIGDNICLFLWTLNKNCVTTSCVLFVQMKMYYISSRKFDMQTNWNEIKANALLSKSDKFILTLKVVRKYHARHIHTHVKSYSTEDKSAKIKSVILSELKSDFL